MASLELGLVIASVSVVVMCKPEVVDADPHCPQEFAEPELLGVFYHDAVLFTVLLLEVDPVFRQFSTEEAIPADVGLLLQEALVSGWVRGRVKVFISEEAKEAFLENVEEYWVYKGADGLQKGI